MGRLLRGQAPCRGLNARPVPAHILPLGAENSHHTPKGLWGRRHPWVPARGPGPACTEFLKLESPAALQGGREERGDRTWWLLTPAKTRGARVRGPPGPRVLGVRAEPGPAGGCGWEPEPNCLLPSAPSTEPPDPVAAPRPAFPVPRLSGDSVAWGGSVSSQGGRHTPPAPERVLPASVSSVRVWGERLAVRR